MAASCLLAVAASGSTSPVAAETLSGFLFAKLGQIGTRSEGPAYFLQKWNNEDIPIAKKSLLFRPDPALEPLVGHKVSIKGTMTGGALDYDAIEPCDGALDCELPGR